MTQEEVETISTSTSKKLIIGLLLLTFISTASADYYYNDAGGISTDSSYFTTPEFESQEELATELVAPFIFISILLHFALSRALNFVLAEDIENKNYHAIPYAIPLRDDGHDRLHPDARRYAMVMSLAITGSLVPTPYWDLIRGIMTSIGTATAIALAGLMLYGFYKVVNALT